VAGVDLSAREDRNRRMLRARDEMDRRYAEPLDVPALAALTHLSPSRFGRAFRDVFGETPHRYLQRRRVERAMALLRHTNRPVTQVAWDVGFGSLGTFSRTFSAVVGRSPSEFRVQAHPVRAPTCFVAAWTRPRDAATAQRRDAAPVRGRGVGDFGEAARVGCALASPT
jgi:transcriptional regulator GlxA family with amidase domain